MECNNIGKKEKICIYLCMRRVFLEREQLLSVHLWQFLCNCGWEDRTGVINPNMHHVIAYQVIIPVMTLKNTVITTVITHMPMI